MLQIMQPNDHPGRQSRTTNVLHKQVAKFTVEKLPDDLIGKLKKRVLPVENLIQAGTK
jgi:hypothetical protein